MSSTQRSHLGMRVIYHKVTETSVFCYPFLFVNPKLVLKTLRSTVWVKNKSALSLFDLKIVQVKLQFHLIHYNHCATERHVGVDSHDPAKYCTVLSGRLKRCFTWQFIHTHTQESNTDCFVCILSHLCLHSEPKLVSLGHQRPVPRHSLTLQYCED